MMLTKTSSDKRILELLSIKNDDNKIEFEFKSYEKGFIDNGEKIKDTEMIIKSFSRDYGGIESIKRILT